MVDDIEPSDGRISSNIDLGQLSSYDEFPPVAQDLFEPVQALEKLGDGLGVRLDFGSETGAVDSVVDLGVDLSFQDICQWSFDFRIETDERQRTHSFNSSISFFKCSGYKSSSAFSLGSCSLKACPRRAERTLWRLANDTYGMSVEDRVGLTVLKNRIISLDSLLTIVLFLVSQTTGTVRVNNMQSLTPDCSIRSTNAVHRPTREPSVVLCPASHTENIENQPPHLPCSYTPAHTLTRICLEINLLDVLAPEQLVLGRVLEILFGDFSTGDGEFPAVLEHVRVDG